MNWNKTITLYNKHEDEESGLITWYRHTLKDCFYKTTNNIVNVGNVQLVTDNNIIRIPEQNNFLPPYEWLEISDNMKSHYMTLQTGDLIFLGDINEIIDENIAGLRSSDLIAKYKSLGSVFIKSFNINTDLPGAHYFVKGE